MTIVTGEWLSFSAIGQREDLLDKIFDISPTEVPFTSMCDKTKANAKTHEWQTDALAAAGSNAQLEGDQYTFSAPSATTRLSNVTQILYKTTSVSRTLDAVAKAGRDREFIYQTRRRGLEVKRDVEWAFLNNQTPINTTADATTARVLRPVNSFMTTNVDRGTGGSDGSASAAATDGTQRELTETMFKTGIKDAWNAGGMPSTVMVGPVNKQRISTFGGNATKYINADERKLIAGIAFYESDFGVHKVVPNRFQRDRDCWMFDERYWAVATLRPMKSEDTANIADSYNGVVLCELTLVSRNEAASAGVVDLTTV